MYLTDTLSRAYIEGEPETGEEMSCVVHSLVENTTVSENATKLVMHQTLT